MYNSSRTNSMFWPQALLLKSGTCTTKVFFLLWICVVDTGSLPLYLRLISSLRTSCLGLSNAGITAMPCCDWLWLAGLANQSLPEFIKRSHSNRAKFTTLQKVALALFSVLKISEIVNNWNLLCMEFWDGSQEGNWFQKGARVISVMQFQSHTFYERVSFLSPILLSLYIIMDLGFHFYPHSLCSNDSLSTVFILKGCQLWKFKCVLFGWKLRISRFCTVERARRKYDHFLGQNITAHWCLNNEVRLTPPIITSSCLVVCILNI